MFEHRSPLALSQGLFMTGCGSGRIKLRGVLYQTTLLSVEMYFIGWPCEAQTRYKPHEETHLGVLTEKVFS